MKRRALAVVLPVFVMLSACGDGGANGDAEAAVELVPEGEDFLATLCFPAADDLLRCEPRAIPAAGSVEETAAAIVQALIDGPGVAAPADRAPADDGAPEDAVPVRNDGSPNVSRAGGAAPPPGEDLFPALPPGVELQAFDLVDGVAWVDLTVARSGAAAARFEQPAMGLGEELLAVYSLVNSLTASDLGIERVVLMWNGEQRLTFAGHVDTTRPLPPDPDRNAAPSADRVRGSSADRVRGSSADRVRGSSADREREPSADWVRGPSADWVRGPSADWVRGPSADWVRGPSADWVRGSSDPLRRNPAGETGADL